MKTVTFNDKEIEVVKTALKEQEQQLDDTILSCYNSQDTEDYIQEIHIVKDILKKL